MAPKKSQSKNRRDEYFFGAGDPPKGRTGSKRSRPRDRRPVVPSFPVPWTLPITHWKKLDRARALVWFWLESLKRAYPDPFIDETLQGLSAEELQTRLDGDESLRMQYGDDSLKALLLKIRAGEHNWLIDCGPLPDKEWGYEWSPPLGFDERNLVQILERGKTRRFNQHFAGFAVNIYANEKVLVRAFKRAVKLSKAQVGFKRAAGAGRKYPLGKLMDTLRLYDHRKKNPGLSLSAIGKESQSFLCLADKFSGTEKEHDLHEGRGEEITALAKKMIAAARTGYTDWIKVFPR